MYHAPSRRFSGAPSTSRSKKPAHVPPRPLAALRAREHVLGDVDLRAARAPRKLRHGLPVSGCVWLRPSRGRRPAGSRARMRPTRSHRSVSTAHAAVPSARSDVKSAGAAASVMCIGVCQRADCRRLQPRYEQCKLRRLERQHVLKAGEICLCSLGRERVAAGTQQPCAARTQHGLLTGCTQCVRMAQRGCGVVLRRRGQGPGCRAATRRSASRA